MRRNALFLHDITKITSRFPKGNCRTPLGLILNFNACPIPFLDSCIAQKLNHRSAILELQPKLNINYWLAIIAAWRILDQLYILCQMNNQAYGMSIFVIIVTLCVLWGPIKPCLTFTCASGSIFFLSNDAIHHRKMFVVRNMEMIYCTSRC